MVYEVPHYIGGKTLNKKSAEIRAITNPAFGEVIGSVSLADLALCDMAITEAKAAFPAWAATTPLKRARILFKFRELMEKYHTDLARIITREHGKTLDDAKGSVARAIEVVEFHCGLVTQLQGTLSVDVSSDMDCYTIRQPLGVCAGVSPFNFPVMVPVWMIIPAIACGNTFILKPSEQDPSACVRLLELLSDAGLPVGVANCIQGDKTAAYGSAGERCMAISVVVAVGDSTADALINTMRPLIESMRIEPGELAGSDMGPLISSAHRERILAAIEVGVQEGATLVVDGRSFRHPQHPNGFFMGPVLFDAVKESMSIYQNEIFGPVLCVIRVESFAEALSLINRHQYGNGTAIFTRDGYTARQFSQHVEVGMVGINVPIPVPVANHPFGGWKRSAFGDTNMHGLESIHFYTRRKTMTSKWPTTTLDSNSSFAMPVND